MPTRYHGFYRSWSALSGYFDGDGTVEFGIKKFRIEIRLAFDDNWKPFLEGIKQFLLQRSVTTGGVRRKQASRTWHLVVSRRKSVLRMARAMLPHLVKKRDELVAVVEYLEGRITGREFVEVMNSQVRRGQRTGKLRPEGPPFTNSAGVVVSRMLGESKRRKRRLTPIDSETAQAILRDRTITGHTYKELSQKYGYSRWILRRVIRDGQTVRSPLEEHKK